MRAERVINLPVLKTHRSASYTICLKNFIGCTHLRQRPYLVDPSHWEEIIAEFNLAFIPRTFTVELKEPFDNEYMKALYQFGYDQMVKGESWTKSPPMFAPPAPTKTEPAPVTP